MKNHKYSHLSAEKVFNYPEDCKFNVIELSELDEDVQNTLKTDGSYRTVYHRLRVYGNSEEECSKLGFEIHEFVFYTDGDYARTLYQVLDPQESRTLEMLLKLGRPFDYIANYLEEIDENLFQRLAPNLLSLLKDPDKSINVYNGHCYYGAAPSEASFSSEELNEWDRIKLVIYDEALKLASNHLHQKGFRCMRDGVSHPDFYFYDNLPLFEQNLDDLNLEEDDRDSLLKNGEYNNYINLYGNNECDGFESIDLVEDVFSLEDRVFCSTVFFWEKSIAEWACGFADTLDILIGYSDTIDEYDLEKKAPTLFKALYNATHRYLDKGALFLIPGKSFFLCQFSYDIEYEEYDKIKDNCKKTVYRLQEEAGAYIRHLQLIENKELQKNKKTNTNFFSRMFGFALLQDAIDGLCNC